MRSDHYIQQEQIAVQQEQIAALQKLSIRSYQEHPARMENIAMHYPAQYRPAAAYVGPGMPRMSRTAWTDADYGVTPDKKSRIYALEQSTINELTFVPDANMRQQLYAQAELALTDRILCSKFKLEANAGEPYDSTLVKVATGRRYGKPETDPNSEWFGKPKEPAEPPPAILSPGPNPKFCVLMDQTPPYLSTIERGCSNGPNGMVVTFDHYNVGPTRTNLFQKNDDMVFSLLNDYMRFREPNKKAMFDAMVEQMVTYVQKSHTEQADVPPEKFIPWVQDQEYITVIGLLQRVSAMGEDEFNATMNVVSYCQTWATRDKGITGPQFSIGSPHFQTRFYFKRIPDSLMMTDREADAYITTIERYIGKMKALGYGGAFVDLDTLGEKMYLANAASNARFAARYAASWGM